jgi:metallophosphoesterase superfamily enzyme
LIEKITLYSEADIAELTEKLRKLSEVSQLMEKLTQEFNQLQFVEGNHHDDIELLFDKIIAVQKEYDDITNG